MHKITSLYLDFVRLGAALLVFFFHAKVAKFDGNWLKEIGVYGHDAVMIFFIISGFVIAYITATRASTIEQFTKARLARLYSVVVPALILTVILDYSGKQINQDMYLIDTYNEYSFPVFRFFVNLFFINELWSNSWIAFSNAPFWSLCYEFWYYVIFACAFYFQGIKKYLFVGIAILMAGPKIILLFPVWLSGVWLYHLSKKICMSKIQAILFIILPIIIYSLYKDLDGHKYLLQITVDTLGREYVYEDLKWSRRFLNDYLVSALFCMNLVGVIGISKYMTISEYIEKPIKHFAGVTFAIYLLHFPLLHFYGTFLVNGITISGLTLGTIYLLAPFTEGRKRQWYVLIDQGVNIFKNKSLIHG